MQSVDEEATVEASKLGANAQPMSPGRGGSYITPCVTASLSATVSFPPPPSALCRSRCTARSHSKHHCPTRLFKSIRYDQTIMSIRVQSYDYVNQGPKPIKRLCQSRRYVDQSSIRGRSGSIRTLHKWMAVLGFAIYIWFVAFVDDDDEMTTDDAG